MTTPKLELPLTALSDTWREVKLPWVQLNAAPPRSVHVEFTLKESYAGKVISKIVEIGIAASCLRVAV